MFRYQARDKSGPMDVDSPEDPLHRLAQFAVPQHEEGPARKRPHSELASPSRSFSAHPSHSPMQFGTNTPFIFHTASLPQPPSSSFKPYDPSEWTSRSFGFGPGPDTPARHHGGGTGVEDVEMRWDSPAKDGVATHENLGGPSTTTAAAAAGGAEGEGRKFAGGAVSRVRKKRQKEWRRKKQDSESEDDGEGREILAGRPDGSGGPQGARKTEHTYNFNVPTPGLRHSEIPALLVGYLQFFVNAAVVVFVLYLAVQFVLTVRRDVKERMQEASVEILQEIAECTKLYLTNRCDPALRVPAMEAPCRAWEACMQRDPTVVGRTNVVAETFAGVINSFVDPISWKTMASDQGGFTLVTLSFLIILTNSALWNIRGKMSEPHPPPQMYHHPLPQPWLTSGQHGLGYGPPQPQHGGQFGPGAPGGPGAGQIGWEGQDRQGKRKGWLW